MRAFSAASIQMAGLILKYYDIHGFSVAVCDEFAKTFEREYGHLSISSSIEANLIAKRSLGDFPIKWPGTEIGLSIPFGEDQREVLVNPGGSSDFVFFSIQPLAQWKDKSLLHSSGAWKEEDAYLFPGASGVGKTMMVLFLLDHGFNFLSDNYLAVGNGKAYPYRRTIHLYQRNLAHQRISNILGRKSLSYRVVFSLMNAARKFARSRMLNFTLDLLAPAFIVNVDEMFPGKLARAPIRIEGIFLLERGDELGIKPISARVLSERATFDFMYNYRRFFAEYYRRAEVYGVSRKIEDIIGRTRESLEMSFARTKSYRITAPSMA